MSRTARAIAGIALIGIALGIGFGWFWPSTATASTDVTERVDAVEIDNDAGDVSVRVGDVTRTTVKQRFEYRFGKPDDAFDLDGDTLVLGDCGWNCTVDYEVILPSAVPVTGQLDSGDLTLDGVAGAEVEVDSGNITLREIAGPVQADADSGDITGSGLGGTITAKADSGSIELRLDRAVDVTADADSGDIELTVPASESYRVAGSSDSGERNIDVRQDPAAEHLLQLDADSGDVAVRGA